MTALGHPSPSPREPEIDPVELARAVLGGDPVSHARGLFAALERHAGRPPTGREVRALMASLELARSELGTRVPVDGGAS